SEHVQHPVHHEADVLLPNGYSVAHGEPARGGRSNVDVAHDLPGRVWERKRDDVRAPAAPAVDGVHAHHHRVRDERNRESGPPHLFRAQDERGHAAYDVGREAAAYASASDVNADPTASGGRAAGTHSPWSESEAYARTMSRTIRCLMTSDSV